MEEINPRIQEHAADAAKGYLNRERSFNVADATELLRLLKRFYRYGLEDRNDDEA